MGAGVDGAPDRRIDGGRGDQRGGCEVVGEYLSAALQLFGAGALPTHERMRLGEAELCGGWLLLIR